MLNSSRSKLYKKLLYISLAIFTAGFVGAVAAALADYNVTTKCTMRTCPSAGSVHGSLVIACGYIAAISFYASLLFLGLWLFARSREKQRLDFPPDDPNLDHRD